MAFCFMCPDAAAFVVTKERDGQLDAWACAIEAARNLLSRESSCTNDARALLGDVNLVTTTTGLSLPNPNPDEHSNSNNIFAFIFSIRF